MGSFELIQEKRFNESFYDEKPRKLYSLSFLIYILLHFGYGFYFKKSTHFYSADDIGISEVFYPSNDFYAENDTIERPREVSAVMADFNSFFVVNHFLFEEAKSVGCRLAIRQIEAVRSINEEMDCNCPVYELTYLESDGVCYSFSENQILLIGEKFYKNYILYGQETGGTFHGVRQGTDILGFGGLSQESFRFESDPQALE